MVPLPLSRRALLAGSAGVGLAASLTPGAAAQNGSAQPGGPRTQSALDFIDVMTTRGQSGPMLPQSYADQLGLFSTAFVYDSALAVCAALAGGRNDLARTIGDGLRFAQEHDPDHDDGRLRQAYNVRPYVFYDGNPQPWGLRRADGFANIGWQFGFLGTAVGDMAWPGIALLQLHAALGEDDHLLGARRIGDWIIERATNPGSLGGFRFGVNGADQVVPNVSTEHNIDCASMFAMLEQLDPDPRWTQARERAVGLIERMWEPAGGYFYTGSNDGDTINRYPLPLDPQTWSWLTLRDDRYASALDWARTALAVHDTPDGTNSQLPEGVSVSGVTFSSASLTSMAVYNGLPVAQQGVWLEGTAQLACALTDRGAARDRARAVALMEQVELVRTRLGAGQTVSGDPVDGGVVAASSLLDSGFGFGYFQVQHVGATAWAVMGQRRSNPMQLGEL